MKENTVMSDFMLFNDIFDEIATKEKEEANFFDSGLNHTSHAVTQEYIDMDITKDSEPAHDPSNAFLQESKETDKGIIKDSVELNYPNHIITYKNEETDLHAFNNEEGNKINNVHSDTHSNESSHSKHSKELSISKKESIENLSNDKYSAENLYMQDIFSISSHSSEGSFCYGNKFDYKYLHDISDSDLNSRNSFISSKKNEHINDENSILSKEEYEEHNSETEEGKNIQFMLRYNNFCAFLEEVKKKVIDQPEEKFEIEFRNKTDYNIENKIDKKKNIGKKKDKSKEKNISLKKPYVTLKLNRFCNDNFFKDENFMIEKKPKINLKINYGLNKEKKLDSQLKATDNPAILSWLSEKEKNEKELKRSEFLQRRLQKKEQRQNKLEKEKLSQISSEKVQKWIEQKKKDDLKKMKHLHPAFEEERIKLLKIEKQINKQQMQMDGNEKRFRFSTAKHKSNCLQENSNARYTYLLNRPSNPVVYISVEAFTCAVINEAINELDMSLRVKSARLGRSKTGLLDPKTSERTPRAPTVLKSQTKVESSNHAITRPAWRITIPGFSRTFEEWLLAKKGLDRIKARERITKHYYDELEKEIVKKEREKLGSERLSSRKRTQSAFNPYILSTQSSTEYMYLAL
ncbi:putative autophagy-related protein 11 [Hydra vulgaris]|uniref:Autophagy-related protein 11 n=1 Tax=Hydra vulgaris TaxID=6087 RepID=A0ABM4B671_HYDVU